MDSMGELEELAMADLFRLELSGGADSRLPGHMPMAGGVEAGSRAGEAGKRLMLGMRLLMLLVKPRMPMVLLLETSMVLPRLQVLMMHMVLLQLRNMVSLQLMLLALVTTLLLVMVLHLQQMSPMVVLLKPLVLHLAMELLQPLLMMDMVGLKLVERHQAVGTFP